MNETWKPLINYKNYEVSSLGRVRHIKHKRIRKPRLMKSGYLCLTLPHAEKRKIVTVKVHKLVAEAFLGAVERQIIDHIDRDRQNNTKDNLRIVTSLANNLNRYPHRVTFINRIIELHQKGHKPEKIAKMI